MTEPDDLDKFLDTFDPDRTRLTTIDLKPMAGGVDESPFILLNYGPYHVVLNPQALNDHLSIDAHPFVTGLKAKAGVMAMTRGRQHQLEHTGTTSYGWPSADLVSIIMGRAANVDEPPTAPSNEALLGLLDALDATQLGLLGDEVRRREHALIQQMVVDQVRAVIAAQADDDFLSTEAEQRGDIITVVFGTSYYDNGYFFTTSDAAVEFTDGHLVSYDFDELGDVLSDMSSFEALGERTQLRVNLVNGSIDIRSNLE